MRVVLDTNVLLSGIFARGVCEGLLEELLERDDVVIVASEHILEEFAEHAASKFRVPGVEVALAVKRLRHIVEVVRPATVEPSSCDDPDDLPVLGAAVAGRADALVTGDRDLLKVGSFAGIPILSPREFYERSR